jgi:hypothetical protein
MHQSRFDQDGIEGGNAYVRTRPKRTDSIRDTSSIIPLDKGKYGGANESTGGDEILKNYDGGGHALHESHRALSSGTLVQTAAHRLGTLGRDKQTLRRIFPSMVST